ncbi:hypothetical protein BVI2075_150079 [Burkholderia vietnamiensis]|nr:hypothetical protein BVI2075_150079 [Burkholderia vietnamiensis]
MAALHRIADERFYLFTACRGTTRRNIYPVIIPDIRKMVAFECVHFSCNRFSDLL